MSKWILVTALFMSACGAKRNSENGQLEPQKVEKPQKVENCQTDAADTCQKLVQKIDDLRAERDKAIEAKDMQRANQLSLEINKHVEILDLLRHGATIDSAQVKDAERRHDILLQIFAKDSRPKTFAYSEEEFKAVQEVVSDFGPLYIRATPSDTKLESAVAEKTPWSSYWYPASDTSLFRGQDAPLLKFDRLALDENISSASVSWEEDRHVPAEAAWEGLCDAWAIAAISSPEPIKDVAMGREVFTTADLKGLAIKKFERKAVKYYGRRYYGSAASDGLIQDIRPEAFHRIVEVMLRDRHQAFIIDDTPEPEVWNKPLFRMEWRIDADPTDDQAFIVKAFPKLIRQRSFIDGRPTTLAGIDGPDSQRSDLVSYEYKYRLVVDRGDEKDGKFRVLYGEWLSSSHPDFITIVDPSTPPSPANPEIGKAMSVLDALLQKSF